MTPTVICFGEVLWDELPTGKYPGGAPMNVAANLRSFGLDAQLISRVGNDDLGCELLEFLDGKGISINLIQKGSMYPTGVTKASAWDNHEVTYEILYPVAWNYIVPEANLTGVAAQSDLFVYGSLAARSPQAYETLLSVASCFQVEVADTVGSGDAFLAGLLRKTLLGATPKETLHFACAAGAYVATRVGSIHSFTEQLIYDQLNKALTTHPFKAN